MDMMQYELDEALRWQAGLNAQRVARGKEAREPFRMSRSQIERIQGEGLLAYALEMTMKKRIAERIALAQERAQEELVADYTNRGLRLEVANG